MEEEGGLSPSNPAEVIAALERYSSNGAAEPVRIADFQAGEEINAIVEANGSFENASLQVKLSDYFQDEAALTYIDRIICWKLGDIDALQRIERSSYMGEPIEFDFEDKEIRYGDSQRSIPILELYDKLES